MGPAFYSLAELPAGPTIWAPPYLPSPYVHEQVKPASFLFATSVLVYGLLTRLSPSSLQTKSNTRQTLVDLLPLPSGAELMTRDDDDYSDYETDEVYNEVVILLSEQELFDRACGTPLPPPTPEEIRFSAEIKTAVEERQEEQGIFGQEPLAVPDGVAVTEEGVGLGAADIVI